MPEVVLAGSDGQPAIDAATGLPVTMEELLRRRGILAHKGVVSPLNQGVPSAAVDALAANAGATTTPSAVAATGADVAANAVSPSVVASSVPAAIATPAAAATTTTDGITAGDVAPWLAVLLAGGAGYAAGRFRRGGTTPGDPETPPTSTDPNSPRRNYNMFREPEDAEFEEIDPRRTNGSGTHQRLDPLLDGQNVTQADKVGAGPARLSGPEPVANDNAAASLAERRGRTAVQDFSPNGQPSTRMQNAARQSNNSRTQPSGSNVIALPDQFTDLTPTELAVARQIQSRIRTDRVSGQAARQRGVRTAGRGAGLPAPAPVYDQASELTEAVALVRRLKAQGVDASKMLPLVRRLR